MNNKWKDIIDTEKSPEALEILKYQFKKETNIIFDGSKDNPDGLVNAYDSLKNDVKSYRRQNITVELDKTNLTGDFGIPYKLSENLKSSISKIREYYLNNNSNNSVVKVIVSIDTSDPININGTIKVEDNSKSSGAVVTDANILWDKLREEKSNGASLTTEDPKAPNSYIIAYPYKKDVVYKNKRELEAKDLEIKTKAKEIIKNIDSKYLSEQDKTNIYTEISSLGLVSQYDTVEDIVAKVIKVPKTESMTNTLNTAMNPELERKMTEVEVVKKPYSSIQKALSADDLKKAANKVDERFDKRIHNVNKGSDGDPYSLLTKLDRPGCIKMYPATKDGYANPERIDCFLIQAVQTSLREKFSIFQSLSGDVLAYFFGKQPVIYRFSAALYNTYNQQWWHDFRNHYDKRLRGTAAIKKNIRTVVSYEDHVIEGFFLEMNSNQSTTNPALVNIDFSILLLQETVLGEYSEPADITGYREDADSLEMNASIRSTDNGLDKPLSNAEINRNNVQARLSIVPTMTTFSLPSGVSSDVYNAALFPTADLEDYLNHLEPGTSGTITMDAATISMTEDGKPDMEKQVTKKNNTEVKNKDELNNKSIEYKKNEEVITSAKNKADDLANRTNTQYGETLKNGTVTVTNSDAKVRIQPNDNAELAKELAAVATDYAYSKTSGSYYYIGKGWIKDTDVKDNTDSKSQDSKPFTTGKLQFHNPATVGRNNMVIRSERSSAQEYLIGTVEYRSGTRYTFTDHKGKWFYVINVPLTDGRVKSGWTFENNVTGIAYDN